jgi:2-oxoglutarate ferredoxin oxidoreductase subunit alpha
MSNQTNDLSIGMAGSGGDGIVSAGESLITALALEGYHGMMVKSFGSQIRGGESSFRLRAAVGPVLNIGGTLDIAVALNWDDFLRFGGELPVDNKTTVVYDANTGVAPDKVPLAVPPAEAIAVPIEQMAKEHAGTDRAKNTIVLGLMAGWTGVARESILAGIRKKFGKKGPELVAANERAFEAGVAFAEQHPLKIARVMEAPAGESKSGLLTDGNDICGAAAIFAGCEFFGGYPITPSTEVMQFMNREIWKYGGSVLQCEDEIAGIGACVGASFAGKKVLTVTSGPGMSLKSEILGLATIAELPLVCVDVQRGGPSTGIPTKGEQADVFQAIFSAHGDVLRPVLAATSVRDVFLVTVEAFNIAEQYQTPVIVLTDGELGQRKEIIDPIDTSALQTVDRRRPTDKELENYVRFKQTESGVSPLSHPGMKGGNYLASGIEHNEQGAPTAKGEVHARMNEKRFKKHLPLKTRRDLFAVEGDKDAEIGLVSWGSVSGVALEALRLARASGIKAKLLIPKLLYPVPEDVYQDFFASVKRGFVLEQSHQGQFYRVIRMFVDVPHGVVPIARSGSNPFLPQEVAAKIREMARDVHHARAPELHPQE